MLLLGMMKTNCFVEGLTNKSRLSLISNTNPDSQDSQVLTVQKTYF